MSIENFRKFMPRWTLPEILFSAAVLGITAGASLYENSSDLTGLLCAVTGICYTLLAGKGTVSCYIFGIVNTSLYGWIAWESAIYGTMLLNWIYYLPMQFAGLLCWLKHTDSASGVVKKRRLPLPRLVQTILLTAAGWIAFALILRTFKGSAPWLDSAATVISISAMILSVLRCFEQWIAWTLVNLINIYLWLGLYRAGTGSFPALLMWCAFLVCGIVFAVQWLKETENGEEKHG